MKNTKSRLIMFWIMAIATVLSIIGGATGLQTLPLFLFLGMASLNLWMKKNLDVGIVVLAVLMVLINLLPEGGVAWADAILWALVALAWK